MIRAGAGGTTAASGGSAERRAPGEAARSRAAVELIGRHEAALRRTARRYSLCPDDAEDAYQRALEILLTKAPTTDPRELIRWTQTVTKHEALAVRRQRERILGRPLPPSRETPDEPDWVQLIPSERDGPADLAERRERVARSREALQALKPQELRALTLLAEGYSYQEIGELTGWSYTKINRCLAEGRQRFRALLTSSEDGRRCADLDSVISAYCDGEADDADTAVLKEHLRACAHCRAKLRAFRAAPRAAAALAPVLPVSRSLLDRAHEVFVGVQSRIPGRTGASETAATQIAAAGGSRGAGMAVVAKVLAACVGTAGGAAACVATGVVPGPVDFSGDRGNLPVVERTIEPVPQEPEAPILDPVEHEPPLAPSPPTTPVESPAEPPAQPERDPEPVPIQSAPASVEFTPEAAVAPPPPAPADSSPAPSASQSSDAGAGEFGP